MKQCYATPLCLGLCLSWSAAAFEIPGIGNIQNLPGALGSATQGSTGSQPADNYLQRGTKVLTSLRKGLEDLTPQEEYYIGRAVTARVFTRYKPRSQAKVNAYLNQLGSYLAQFSKRPETFNGYHFQLVDSNEINAFAAPSGFIVITTGLYKSLSNEEQLAAVLAHEIAHVTLKHGLSAIKTANLTEAFTLIGQTYMEQKASSSAASIQQLAGVFGKSIDDIINKMVVSGYSRGQELDADKESLAILFQAGYNPQGLTQFLETLHHRSGASSTAGFYDTHPPAANRLSAAQDLVRKNGWQAEDSASRTQRFQQYRL
jgi:beta-barrel assembly-enhancing protease